MDTIDRYARQTQLTEVGAKGQARLMASSVLVLGCGALGSNLASLLTRAGVGRIRVVDRDILELNNLQRQVLFDEGDVAAGLPKAEAAARRLRRINSAVEVEAQVSDATSRNIERMLDGINLLVDGTDNLETRYLLNDVCVKLGMPWIYGGVIGTTGMSMTIVPGEGPCLRCVFPSPPPPGSLPTCETRGILGTLPAAIAAVQATEAIKLLCGGERSPSLLSLDLWRQTVQQVKVLRDDQCPTCGQRRFEFLDADRAASVSTLCGRSAIQITPAEEVRLDLNRLAADLSSLGQVSHNGLLLQFKPAGGDLELVLFPDGRMLVRGTTSEAAARALYARYVGT